MSKFDDCMVKYKESLGNAQGLTSAVNDELLTKVANKFGGPTLGKTIN